MTDGKSFRVGLSTFVTDYSMPVAELAVAAEERGLESLFVTEHTHIPVESQSDHPAGNQLAREYYHTLDPFVALGAAAAVTSTLLLGTSIILVTERDPIVTAKEVATLDHICGGRFLFGIGAGWNRQEMINHGTDPRRRWTVTRERIAAMRTIWSEEKAEFHGEFVDFDPIWSWPKPVQKPGPPVLIGGTEKAALDRVVEYGDGWLPIYAIIRHDLAARVAELDERAAAAGRDRLPVTVFAAPDQPAQLAALAEAGVARALLPLPSAGRDETLTTLDAYADLIGQL